MSPRSQTRYTKFSASGPMPKFSRLNPFSPGGCLHSMILLNGHTAAHLQNLSSARAFGSRRVASVNVL